MYQNVMFGTSSFYFISLFMKILFSFPVIIMPFLLRMKHIDSFFLKKLFYFSQFSCLRVDDITMQIDILGNEWVVTDGVDCISDRILCIVKTFQPMIKVDTAKSDSINDILMDSSLDHEFFHLLSVHVAGTTVGMGDDHDFLYS